VRVVLSLSRDRVRKNIPVTNYAIRLEHYLKARFSQQYETNNSSALAKKGFNQHLEQ